MGDMSEMNQLPAVRGHSDVEVLSHDEIESEGLGLGVSLEDGEDNSSDENDRPTSVLIRLRELKQEQNERWIEVGRLLLESKQYGYARKWGYLTLDEFVDKEFGLAPRTGRYLVEVVQTYLLDLKCREADLISVGWTKAQKMIPIVNDANLSSWIDYAKLHTVKEVELKVKLDLGDEGAEKSSLKHQWGGLVTPGQADVANQAVERAKREGSTRDFGEALEAITAEFLSRDELPRYTIVKAVVDALTPLFCMNSDVADLIPDHEDLEITMSAETFRKIRGCLMACRGILYPPNPEDVRVDVSQEGPGEANWSDVSGVEE